MGDKLCRLDATAFGHLSEIWYSNVESNVKKFMGTDCKNLVEYLERIKKEFWPDWNEATEKLSLDTKFRN